METRKLKSITAVYEACPPYCTATHLQQISSPKDIVSCLQGMGALTKEVFVALHLDTKNRILCIDTVSVGSLNASIVHPREIFKTALLSNACAIAFAHNHPSGDQEPSKADIEVTKKLVDAGTFLEIKVIDHVVIGEGGGYYSFAEQGRIYN